MTEVELESAVVPVDVEQLEKKRAKQQPEDGEKNRNPLEGVNSELTRPGAVSLLQLVRFADNYDVFLMVLGTISSTAAGLALPGFALLFGDLIGSFDGSTNVEDDIRPVAVKLTILAVGVLVATFLGLATWMLTAERQATTMKRAFFRSVMRQDRAWFDMHTSGAIFSEFNRLSVEWQDAIGDKVFMFYFNVVAFVGGIALGFWKGWQLSLVIMAFVPFLGLTTALYGLFLQKLQGAAQDAYQRAGTIADEALQQIRTVTAFGQQHKALSHYTSNLDESERIGLKQSVFNGGLLGVVMMLIFAAEGVGMWYGAMLVREETKATNGDPYDAASVMGAFFGVFIGAMSIGQAVPSITAAVKAKAAAFKLWNVIDRESAIDPLNRETGKTIEDGAFQGEITLEDVHFCYPSRPDQPLFQGLSVSVLPGQKVAFVGGSGSGKSTILKLVQRLYDPARGRVSVDGVPLKDLNVAWWRAQMGVVSQMPILFQGSIADNVRFGRPDSIESVTDADVEAALKKANAWDFVQRLPDGVNSFVGEGGSQLSGGQKQRIAIARAIVRDPKILILDEATSALDNESERIVQEALDRLMEGRTTLVVAHRLSTIRNSDKIVVVQDGVMVEEGPHDELLQSQGLYFALCMAQAKHDAEDAAQAGDVDMVDQARRESVVLLHDAERVGVISQEVEELRKRASEMSVLTDTAAAQEKEPAADEKIDKKNADDAVDPEDVKWEVPEVAVSRVFALQKNDVWYIVLGAIGCAFSGVAQPVIGLLFGEMTNLFLRVEVLADPEKQKDDALLFMILFIGMGLLLLFGSLIRGYGFGVSGERLTKQLRVLSFDKILRFEMGWHDDESHSSAVVASRLASDASLVQGVTTLRLAQFCEMISLIVSGMIIAFYHSWQISLLSLAVLPIMSIAAVWQYKALQGMSAEQSNGASMSDLIAGESIQNVDTVAAFGGEQLLTERYAEALQGRVEKAQKAAAVAGFGMGFSNFVMFASYALNFWVGAKLVDGGHNNFQDMMVAVFSFMFVAFGLGQIGQMAPDAAKASTAKDRIFYMVDRSSPLDPNVEEGRTEPLTGGAIEFEDVKFAYPTRPESQVLKGLSFAVPSGCTLALVGQSGSGKSTIVSLLQRFYDVTGGSVKVDGVDVRDMNIQALRRTFGYVQQEPQLFNVSIAENLRYAKPDATQEEMEAAAKAANIHETIIGFQNGYATIAGERGSKLSGGQRQRIAIARAILRNPTIMLLDEATSALDSESERVVQEALDNLMNDSSRTTVVIAHRLSTIRAADAILVMDSGRFVEMGTHEELMEARGYYFNLIRAGLGDESSSGSATPTP